MMQFILFGEVIKVKESEENPWLQMSSEELDEKLERATNERKENWTSTTERTVSASPDQ
jgi:hypothetical protein